MAAPKATYKIWIIDPVAKAGGRFWSNSRKASWTSETWALYAAADAAKKYGKQRIEILVYPLAAATRISYDNFVDDYQERQAEKEKSKLNKQKEAEYRSLLEAQNEAARQLVRAQQALKDFSNQDK